MPPMLVLIVIAALMSGCGRGESATREEAPSSNAPPASHALSPARAIKILPGAKPFPSTLQRRMDVALAAMGHDYRPHTRHLTVEGKPVYTNRLILESSPYLLQHAHNPVNWYPWGDEAFETARREARPVILSVGYSTCHWCHVMEEESFEDEAIAQYLNEHYVMVKVDREERPDIDGVYMLAVQALTGGGGWPMTVWLTPDRKPFFGGTYFPAHDGDRGARVGFLTLAQRLRKAYDEQGDAVAAQAGVLTKAIQTASAPLPAERVPGPELLRAAAERLAATFDPVNGGFGREPKFPETTTLSFLLRYHRRTGDEKALDMVEKSLSQMANGGIHDQVGGGFHRYATDAAWQKPHFEKMLYDNALLATLYTEAWQVTGKREYAEVARGILDDMMREMRGPDGGFFAAMDADSEGREGRFYLWTPAEIDQVLSGKRGRLVRAYYGVTDGGNFDGANILHMAMDLEAAARAARIPAASSRAELEASRALLFDARAKRVPPHTDRKVLTGWNGLMISALARASLALEDPRYAREARRTADFLLAKVLRDGRLRRIWTGEKAKVEGTLEDYAYFTAGLLDLFEATSDLRYLQAAQRLARALDERFADTKKGGYFLTPSDGEALLAREKPYLEAATPSGNAVAALNLLRLAEFTSDDSLRKRADAAIRAASGVLDRAPTASASMLAAIDFRHDLPKEIVIVSPDAAGARPFLARLARTYTPNRVVVVMDVSGEEAELSTLIPLVTGKRPLGAATAYVCEQRVCALPTTDPVEFARQIGRVRKLP